MRKPVVVLGSIAVSALLAVSGVAPAAARVLASAQALTWSVVPTPNRGTGFNGLSAVSCVSAAACMAVGGSQGSSGAARTLAESWDGTRWSVVPTPSRGLGGNALFAVSCLPQGACMAVGDSGIPSGGASGLSRSGEMTLIELWNGARWSLLPSPSPGSTGSFVTGVSCVSDDACMAVGSTQNSSLVVSTLAESWNGTRWSVVPTPSPVPGSDGFDGVSCVTEDACMAVGFSGINATGFHATLAESWNGTRWSVVPSPSPGTRDNYLNGVSCASAGACMATGAAATNSAIGSPLIESWNGTRWSVLPSPSPGTQGTLRFLNGVSCASAAACSIVGYDVPAAGGTTTLIESWDGTRWSVVPSPSPPRSELSGVSCVSAVACTAAGFHFTSENRTLIESGTASG